MSEPVKIHLPEIIGIGYGDFWRSRDRYRVVKGGKASKKSSTAALWYIVNMMRPEYAEANLLVVRKVMDTHRTSTLAQLQWAVSRLHVEKWWKITKTPMEMTYLPTGQKILFRGMDDALKLASITVPTGHLCWVWIEEAYEIDKESEFDKLDLSAPRGTVPEPLFKQTTLTFNPWNEKHWLKRRFFDEKPENAYVNTTTYAVNEFLDETDRAIYREMQEKSPRKYAVVGLGEWGVAEGLVFDNWVIEGFDLKKVTAGKPWQWKHVFGLDYGYTNDPTAFVAMAVNPREKLCYIYDENYQTKMLNDEIAGMIRKKGYAKEKICADAAEPKSNDDLRRLGIVRIHPAQKGADSIRNGISRLQEYRIVIHPDCGATAAEIASYAWQVDKSGQTINRPTDKDNHIMDAMRYAMEDIGNWMPPEEEPKKRPTRHGNVTDDVNGAWG